MNQGYDWPGGGLHPINNAKKLEKIINILPSEWMEQLKKTAGFPDQFEICGYIRHNLRSSSDQA